MNMRAIVGAMFVRVYLKLKTFIPRDNLTSKILQLKENVGDLLFCKVLPKLIQLHSRIRKAE